MTKKSSTNTLIKILVGLVLFLALLAVLAKSLGWMDRGGSEWDVQTELAKKRTISQEVAASGRIQPEIEVIIRPDVSGEIIQLNVVEGDFVREGDLLLRIKPDIYEARIDELNAQLLTQRARMEQTRAGLLQAETEFIKNSELYERSLISEVEYLQSKNNYEAQKASLSASEYQIESASAQLRRAEEELQQTVIRAPQSGTISSLAVEQGERVLGQAQTAGTEMMRIVRMEQMEIEVEVNENDIINVSMGDTAAIEVDAYPNRSFEGIVTEIANSADITGSGSAQQVTNYMVKIRITTPHNLERTVEASMLMASYSEQRETPVESPRFKPGMSGTVDIRTKTVTNVVSVPIQAVTVRDFAKLRENRKAGDGIESKGGKDRTSEGDETGVDETGDNETDGYKTSRAESEGNESGIDLDKTEEDIRRVVFIMKDGKAEMKEVETGISDNRYIQIMNGVSEGDRVVTGSYRILSRDLKDGDQLIENQKKEND